MNFELEVDLSRYSATMRNEGSPIRLQTNKLRAELKEARESSDHFLFNLTAHPIQRAQRQAFGDGTRKQLAAAYAPIDSGWPYTLMAAWIHSGPTPDAGHYWFVF